MKIELIGGYEKNELEIIEYSEKSKKFSSTPSELNT